MRRPFRDDVHVRGSAILEVRATENRRKHTLEFSGDLGWPERQVTRALTPTDSADAPMVETTWNHRPLRPLNETIDELVFVIEETLRRCQGNGIIPAFALGRTPELPHLLLESLRQRRPPVPAGRRRFTDGR